MAHHYIPIVYAGIVTCAARTRARSSPTCRRSAPNWFFAVPRIWEKLKAGLEAMQAAQPEEQRGARGGRAGGIARARAPAPAAASPCPKSSRRRWRRPTSEMFSKLREMLGLDQADRGQRRRRADAGRGARVLPRDRDRARRSCGACPRPAAPGRATGPATSRSAPSDRPPPGVELRLADDGEVLVRGEFVMIGYRNAPEKTAEAIDAGRLAAHRRHRRDRRRRLPQDRRPQEGADHQRGRQEHVAGEHRGGAQDRAAR